MCFSPYAEYVPRPVAQMHVVRPEGAPPTDAERDANLFGPKPMPSDWIDSRSEDLDGTRAGSDNGHETATATNEIVTVSGGSTKTIEAVVIELKDGTRLLVCTL